MDADTSEAQNSPVDAKEGKKGFCCSLQPIMQVLSDSEKLTVDTFHLQDPEMSVTTHYCSIIWPIHWPHAAAVYPGSSI